MENTTEKQSLPPPAIDKRYKLLKKSTIIIIYFFLILFIGLMLFAGYQAFINKSDVPRNRDITRYKDILTEEEQIAWNSRNIQKGEVIFQLNLVIPVVAATSRAEIRLIHPPYSDFICKVLIRDKESNIVLYQSEEMIPGTLIQYIDLSETLAVGQYDAIVEYTFLDGKGKVQGNYEVEVVLDVKDEGKDGGIINPYDDLIESESGSQESAAEDMQ